MADLNPTIPSASQIQAWIAQLPSNDDDSEVAPVPATGPYGAPSVTPSPLAAALGGAMPGTYPSAPMPAAGSQQPSPQQQAQIPVGTGIPPDQRQGYSDALAGRPPPAPTRVAAAAPAAPADDSDTTDDAYTAGLRKMHDEAMQHFNTMQAKGDAAWAAGNNVAAQIYFKQASDFGNTADQVNLAALKNLQADTTDKITNYEYGLSHPGFEPPAATPHPVTADERAAWGLPATGAFTLAPGEAPKPITGAGPQGEPLDQPSIDYLATRLQKYGDNTALTGLGYGKIGAENRARVINRAAAMGTAGGMDAGALAGEQVGNQVQLGGDRQAGRTVGALGGRISTFAEEAAQTGELALTASEAVPRTQWVPINQILQMGEAAHSNPALSAFTAANNEFATTYAKAANPSGIPTDEGRRAAFAILNVAKSPEAYEASVRQLQKGIRAIQSSVGVSRENIRNNVVAPQGAPTGAAAPPRIRVYDPATGTLR